MTRYLSKIVFFLLTAITVSSCTTNDFTRHRLPDVEAPRNGFSKKIVKGGDFWLTTYQKVTSPDMPYVFYIEGDGLAFRNRGQFVSKDPSPKNPMLLNLAFLDKRPNVVYVARPCQYTNWETNPKCNASFWTDKRMSREVIDSIDEVIASVAKNNNINLVGFSGGGGVAVLVAAKNPNIKSILTIAGNLDIDEFIKYHKVRPMIGSLNPLDVAKKVSYIPQIHVSGGKDNRVPVYINDKFIKASGNPSCVQREILPDVDHEKGWDKHWHYLINIPNSCVK